MDGDEGGVPRGPNPLVNFLNSPRGEKFSGRLYGGALWGGGGGVSSSYDLLLMEPYMPGAAPGGAGIMKGAGARAVCDLRLR